MATRHLEKFTNSAGTVSYSFPLNMAEYAPSQPLRQPSVQIAGADYAYRLRGSLPGLKALGQERVRFLNVGATSAAVESAIDEMRSELFKIGMGKGYLLDSDASERWAWMDLAAMPEITVAVRRELIIPTLLTLNRYTDWFGAAQSVNQTVAASPTTWTVTNPGNANAYAVVMRLRANTGTGFVNPRLDNLTNGYYWSSTRDSASADDELKVDAGAQTVQYSPDDGVSYANDFSLFTRGTSQIAYMVLAPGDNSIRYTGGGSPSLDVLITFDAVYH